MTTAFSQGIALHYQIEGAPDAPVLVMSNSLGTDLQMWAPQMDSLLSRFRVLRATTRAATAAPACRPRPSRSGLPSSGRTCWPSWITPASDAPTFAGCRWAA
ncbi:hypothetical protein ACU4GD_30485 [Cupriavidus basilensis]